MRIDMTSVSPHSVLFNTENKASAQSYHDTLRYTPSVMVDRECQTIEKRTNLQGRWPTATFGRSSPTKGMRLKHPGYGSS